MFGFMIAIILTKKLCLKFANIYHEINTYLIDNFTKMRGGGGAMLKNTAQLLFVIIMFPPK